MNTISVQPVFLPSGPAALEREPLSPVRHTDKEPLQSEDLAAYDSKTVLYDIFWREDSAHIEALGPPLLNLRQHLLPIRCQLDGKERPVRVGELGSKGLTTLSIRAPQGRASAGLKLTFGDAFTWSGEIARDPACGPAKLTVSTLQKNNRQRWIDDWSRYYASAHGVDRVVLYDNGSDVQPTLQELPAGSFIIPWAFPYGPMHSHPNKFTQLGSLNHARMRFGTRTPILNFDIDELLVVRSRSVRRLMAFFPSMRFDNYRVPYVAPEDEDFSFADFPLRANFTKKASYKFSYRPHLVSALAQHRVETRSGRRTLSPVIPPSAAYFLHYMGITTNWKAEYWDRKKAKIAEERLVHDSSIKEFLL